MQGTQVIPIETHRPTISYVYISGCRAAVKAQTPKRCDQGKITLHKHCGSLLQAVHVLGVGKIINSDPSTRIELIMAYGNGRRRAGCGWVFKTNSDTSHHLIDEGAYLLIHKAGV